VSESQSVVAPVRLLLRQSHALRCKPGSDGGITYQTGEDGQQIGVARTHAMTHLSETTSKDLIIATTDLFGNDFLVNRGKIPFILRAFIRYLKRRKPPIQ
jgi:hypothetical protein